VSAQFDDPGRDRATAAGTANVATCAIDFVGDLYDWQQAQLIAIAKRHIAAWNSLVVA
jgi:hypothetical protein